jgi:oligopeptide/dipeptide ABC transporter ATP-binding protein
MTPLLKVTNLAVEFVTYGGIVCAVRGVDFELEAGKTLAIVGESGCGKSVTVQSMMGLTPMPPGRLVSGSARLRGEEILGQRRVQGKEVRGAEIGMIFQDPITSLNPTMTIGDQIAEPLQVHRGFSGREAFNEAVKLLELTKIPEAQKRAKQYPFEFSGGMLQRAMIAMAIACKPSILIADEPTTALDVTIQAQILDLLQDIQQEIGMAIILITHDLGVVARVADEVAVMYAGKVVEFGKVDDIFYRSAHPYTVGLRAAMPVNDPSRNHVLSPIEGSPPDLFSPPAGCGYCSRCPEAMEICATEAPPTKALNRGHTSSCWLQQDGAPHPESLFFNEEML